MHALIKYFFETNYFLFVVGLLNGCSGSTGQPLIPISVENPIRSCCCLCLLWHVVHRDCQLSTSQNSVWSPLCGTMWSTVVALTTMPLPAQCTHSGLAAR